MTDSHFRKLALEIAAKSPCKKRKVGAIITADDSLLVVGYNHNYGLPCEDSNGRTYSSVVHAEVDAVNKYVDIYKDKIPNVAIKIYVTHQPCEVCMNVIKAAYIKEVIVVEEFMKFDGDKLRYDLIPPEATKALARVLTYGARKYKPDNWRKVDDVWRYKAALMRHYEAWREGETHDKESGMHHLEHMLCNAAFLVALNNTDPVAEIYKGP